MHESLLSIRMLYAEIFVPIYQSHCNQHRSRIGISQRLRSLPAICRLAVFETMESRRLLAAIRVATYNVLQGSPDNQTEQGYYSTIIDAIGNETKAGVTRPVDLLVLQETDAGSISSIEAIFDSLYADDYARVLSPSYQGLAYGFVYNTATLQLLGRPTCLAITRDRRCGVTLIPSRVVRMTQISMSIPFT